MEGRGRWKENRKNSVCTLDIFSFLVYQKMLKKRRGRGRKRRGGRGKGRGREEGEGMEREENRGR